MVELAASYGLCPKCRLTALAVLRACGWCRAADFVERNKGR